MLYVKESFRGPFQKKIGPGSSRQPGIKTREAEAALAAGDLPCPLYISLAWFVCLYVTEFHHFCTFSRKMGRKLKPAIFPAKT